MRILVIHQFYLRAGEGGGSRFNEMTRLWQHVHGHEVKIIAGQVSYTRGHRREGDRLLQQERGEHGEEIYRLFTPGTYQRGVLGRAWSVGGFAAMAALVTGWMPGELLDWADVAIVTSPPLTLGVLPWWLGKVRPELPILFEVRDLWPESAVATGALEEGGLPVRLLYRLEALAYRHAARVVALTPAIASNIVERDLAERVEVVPNGADERMLTAPTNALAARASLGFRPGHFIALYAGAHGIANDLGQLLDAAEIALHEGMGDAIEWVCVGDGPQKSALMKESIRRGLRNVTWRDSVGRAEIKRYFDAADCGLAILRRTDTFKTVYPNKIFDAMSRSRPVCCGVDGAARLLLEGEGAGVYFEPGDPRALYEAISELVRDPAAAHAMGARGRALVERSFSRRALAARYAALLEEVVWSRSPI